MAASLALSYVNICLIPESLFYVYGNKSLLEFIAEKLKVKNRCIIVVAECAYTAMIDKKIDDTGKTDKSCNKILPDIGQILKNEIIDYFKRNKWILL